MSSPTCARVPEAAAPSAVARVRFLASRWRAAHDHAVLEHRHPTALRALAGALLCGAALGGDASAQDVGLVVPAGTRSLEVVASGATVRAGPSISSARRGTVRVGTRLAFEARVDGDGCPGGEWYRLAAEQYVCESLVRPSTGEPFGDDLGAAPASGRALRREHAFVASDGTWAYARPEDYFRDDWAESLGEGFGIAIVEHAESGGVGFARTLSGLWVAEDELRYARGSEHVGVEIVDGVLDVAWVRRGGARVRAWNGRRATSRVARRAGAREVVEVLEEVTGGLRVADGVIAARDLNRPTLAPPPPEVTGADETWIDIDVDSQTLVVYRGVRPFFATLVSTGRHGHDTPTGTFRIWVKLAEDGMDDLERTDAESNYLIEAVPWVQYFSEGVALHAAFWHDDFGRTHSHGCVNLSPRDAQRVFALTEPALPVGWDAILPTASSPGTVVRVR